jgi:hypothetical protein
LWGQYCSGRLTASNFGAIIKCIDAHRKPSASLLKTLLGEYNAAGAKAVQWGMLHEKTAVEKYEAEKGIVVKPSGLWLHKGGFCGASPDGVVDDIKILEVKCPFSIREENLINHIGGNFFLNVNYENAVALNLSNPQGYSYYHQVQGNLWLTGRCICDFVVWTPQSIIILGVESDEQYESKYLDLITGQYSDGRYSDGRYSDYHRGPDISGA